MLKIQHSLKTQLVAFAMLGICFAILDNRARNQWHSARQITDAGGEVYFPTYNRADGVGRKCASTQNYLPHLYQSISHVTLHPDTEHPIANQIRILSKIPRLTSLCIWPDCNMESQLGNSRSPNGVTDADIEAIADTLPRLRNFNATFALCNLEKGKWLEGELPNLNSGSISWHSDVNELGWAYHFGK